MSKVSVIIPSRNEIFLDKTVEDLLAKATGSIEIIAVLDGYWPEQTERWKKCLEDKRVKILHRGKAQGMRQGINAGVQISTGEYIFKLDGHCKLDEGFDEVLVRDCHEDNWVLVPRRMSLDPIAWDTLANGKPPVDYHYLSNPLERPNDPSCGLHGSWWRERAKERAGIALDEEQSSQGSAWFTSRKHWDKGLGGEMSASKYGQFASEFQEIGNTTWLGGGAVMITKNTRYWHLHKGVQFGRGYSISKRDIAAGGDFSTRYWMLDEWKDRQHDLIWLIQRFWPVPSWGDDPEKVFAEAKKTLQPTGYN